MAQIDTRDVKNSYDQARAALTAAQARVQVTRAQKKRADDLFAEQVITASEHETAMLDDANSQAQLVKARTDLDLAQQRLEDATVSAPIEGTVLEKPVSVGQVISSATSSVSGGTTLLKMADLSRIRVRALVSETDIGRVRDGLGATVVVDAYPQRPFRGVVEKIEPQAVVQQSVTMFPVLISIENEQGLLMPGMNGEVTVLVDEREGVLAVPVDALRGVREITAIAKPLGLNPDSVSAQVRAQTEAMMLAMRAAADSGGGAGLVTAGGPGPGGAMAQTGARGGAAGAGQGQGEGAGRGNWSRGGGAGGATGGGAGGGNGGGWRRGAGRQGAGGAGAAGGEGAGGGYRRGTGAGGGGMAGGAGVAGGAGGAGGARGNSGAGGGGGRGRGSRAQVVVVKTKDGYAPRVVRVGISNYDYTEILQGVQEGEPVVLLGVVDLQQQRDDSMQRIRQRMGSGLPGQGGSGAGGAGRGAGGTGGGGAGRSGGGASRGGGS
jgi:HlyD family secretion protein